MSRDKHEEEGPKFLGKLIGKLCLTTSLLPVVMIFFPRVVPFQFLEFWSVGRIREGIVAGWPMFLWGTGVTGIICLVTSNELHVNRHAERILHGGAVRSVIAGVWEEICFRWLFFLTNIITVKMANFLFFGFLGIGLPQFFHIYVLGPFANLTTLGALEPYLFHPSGWAVGAAMLATNAFFRDGHKHKGVFGWINSWFCGMFLFWIMFQYGLPAAIMVHFIYDFLIYVVAYLDAAFERALGWA